MERQIEGSSLDVLCQEVAVPDDADEVAGIWHDASETKIGREIWGSFAIIQEVENDHFAGIHGKQYGIPTGPGFGKFN